MINLIPGKVLLERERKLYLKLWIWRISALVLFCLLFYGASARLVADKVKQFDSARAEYNSLLGGVSSSSSLIMQRDELWQRWETVEAICNPKTTAWYLEILGEAMPTGCRLNHLKLDIRDSSTLVSRSEKDDAPDVDLSFDGDAGDHIQVRSLIRALKTCGVFSDVQLVSASDKGGPAGDGTVSFELSCENNEHN